MIISFTNHKGGTGKTTSALNLATGLRQKGKNVLVIDLDPQANLSYSLGIIDAEKDACDWLLNNCSIREVMREAGGLHLIPSSISLYEKEPAFIQVSSRFNHRILREALQDTGRYYDYIIIDCPPSFSVFTINALTASDYAIIPTNLDVLSVQGIDQVLAFISGIINSVNPELKVLGVLGVNVDERRQLTYEVLEHIRDNYYVNIFNNYIRSNVKAAEAPSFAKSVIDYAPDSNSARDYLAFTKEFLGAVEQLSKEEPQLT